MLVREKAPRSRVQALRVLAFVLWITRDAVAEQVEEFHASTHLSQTACEEAGARSVSEPDPCPETGYLLETERIPLKTGPGCCRVEKYEYPCKKPSEGISLKHRVKYFVEPTCAVAQTPPLKGGVSHTAPAGDKGGELRPTESKKKKRFERTPQVEGQLGSKRFKKTLPSGDDQPLHSVPPPRPTPVLPGEAQATQDNPWPDSTSQPPPAQTKRAVLVIPTPFQKDGRTIHESKITVTIEDPQNRAAVSGPVTAEYQKNPHTETFEQVPNFFTKAWGKVRSNYENRGTDYFEFEGLEDETGHIWTQEELAKHGIPRMVPLQ
jgi:hypothetical protein